MAVDGKGPLSCSSSPIARALQKHFPFTVAVFEHSLKLIALNFPVRCCQPIVALNVPSSRIEPGL